MKFIQQRLFDNGTYTLGFIQNEQRTFHSFSCEDTFHAVKIAGETRIPSGFYELKIHQDDTPLTQKHRAAYGAWFKRHIEITNIPNYSGVYIHVGKDQDWTEGCDLLGYEFNLSATKSMQNLSLEAVKDFYLLVYPLLESGSEKCFIEIRDELK